MRQVSKGQQITVTHNTYRPRMSRFDEWETEMLSRVQKTGDGDWLIWLGAKSSNGYVMIRVKLGGELEPSKVIGVHRLMAMRQLGTVVLPADLQVSHLCQNKMCVNKEHICLNTDSINQQRRIANQGLDVPDTDYTKAVYFSKTYF